MERRETLLDLAQAVEDMRTEEELKDCVAVDAAHAITGEDALRHTADALGPEAHGCRIEVLGFVNSAPFMYPLDDDGEHLTPESPVEYVVWDGCTPECAREGVKDLFGTDTPRDGVLRVSLRPPEPDIPHMLGRIRIEYSPA